MLTAAPAGWLGTPRAAPRARGRRPAPRRESTSVTRHQLEGTIRPKVTAVTARHWPRPACLRQAEPKRSGYGLLAHQRRHLRPGRHRRRAARHPVASPQRRPALHRVDVAEPYATHMPGRISDADRATALEGWAGALREIETRPRLYVHFRSDYGDNERLLPGVTPRSGFQHRAGDVAPTRVEFGGSPSYRAGTRSGPGAERWSRCGLVRCRRRGCRTEPPALGAAPGVWPVRAIRGSLRMAVLVDAGGRGALAALLHEAPDGRERRHQEVVVPLIQVKLIENVFAAEQKQDIVEIEPSRRDPPRARHPTRLADLLMDRGASELLGSRVPDRRRSGAVPA
jgi:hypothetical protein